ncbi:hypothetical protein MHYP_G00233110 [Metynnis hypsauchen]
MSATMNQAPSTICGKLGQQQNLERSTPQTELGIYNLKASISSSCFDRLPVKTHAPEDWPRRESRTKDTTTIRRLFVFKLMVLAGMPSSVKLTPDSCILSLLFSTCMRLLLQAHSSCWVLDITSGRQRSIKEVINLVLWFLFVAMEVREVQQQALPEAV